MFFNLKKKFFQKNDEILMFFNLKKKFFQKNDEILIFLNLKIKKNFSKFVQNFNVF